nr:unnamed protein product [Digitaria exilis]
MPLLGLPSGFRPLPRNGRSSTVAGFIMVIGRSSFVAGFSTELFGLKGQFDPLRIRASCALPRLPVHYHLRRFSLPRLANTTPSCRRTIVPSPGESHCRPLPPAVDKGSLSNGCHHSMVLHLNHTTPPLSPLVGNLHGTQAAHFPPCPPFCDKQTLPPPLRKATRSPTPPVSPFFLLTTSLSCTLPACSGQRWRRRHGSLAPSPPFPTRNPFSTLSDASYLSPTAQTLAFSPPLRSSHHCCHGARLELVPAPQTFSSTSPPLPAAQLPLPRPAAPPPAAMDVQSSSSPSRSPLQPSPAQSNGQNGFPYLHSTFPSRIPTTPATVLAGNRAPAAAPPLLPWPALYGPPPTSTAAQDRLVSGHPRPPLAGIWAAEFTAPPKDPIAIREIFLGFHLAGTSNGSRPLARIGRSSFVAGFSTELFLAHSSSLSFLLFSAAHLPARPISFFLFPSFSAARCAAQHCSPPRRPAPRSLFSFPLWLTCRAHLCASPFATDTLAHLSSSPPSSRRERAELYSEPRRAAPPPTPLFSPCISNPSRRRLDLAPSAAVVSSSTRRRLAAKRLPRSFSAKTPPSLPLLRAYDLAVVAAPPPSVASFHRHSILENNPLIDRAFSGELRPSAAALRRPLEPICFPPFDSHPTARSETQVKPSRPVHGSVNDDVSRRQHPPAAFLRFNSDLSDFRAHVFVVKLVAEPFEFADDPVHENQVQQQFTEEGKYNTDHPCYLYTI